MDEKGHGVVRRKYFGGAEVCFLAGTFGLATLSKKIPSVDTGLYRHAGPGALCGTYRALVRIFEEMGLRSQYKWGPCALHH